MPPIAPDLQGLVDDLSAGRSEVTATGCPPAMVGYFVSRLQRALDRPLLIVVTDDDRARVLERVVNVFAEPVGHLAAACVFSALEVSPYAGISPSRFASMERVAALFRCSQTLPPRVLIVPVRALSLRTLPLAVLGHACDWVVTGEGLDRDRFLKNLVAVGYHSVPAVEDPGTFAARGGVIDVFSPLYPRPVRIDMWGDEVESVRMFDPDSQRGLQRLHDAYICPARETLLNEHTVERALSGLRELGDAGDLPTERLRALSDELRRGFLGVGMEFLLPALYDRFETLLDYQPGNAVVVLEEPDGLTEQLHSAHEDLQARWANRGSQHPLAYAPEGYFANPDATLSRLEHWPRLALRSVVVAGESDASVHTIVAQTHGDLIRDLQNQPTAAATLKPLADHLRRWQSDGLTAVIASHTNLQQERLRAMLGHHGLKATVCEEPISLDLLARLQSDFRSVHLVQGDLEQGFRHPATGLALLDESEIFGRKQRRAQHRRGLADLLPALSDLRPGDFVVHIQHGIGRFVGLVKLAVAGNPCDFLEIQYREGNKLFLPVHNLNRLEKYASAEQAQPPLDKLGGVSWERVKTKVKAEVRALAEGLIKLYAAREALPGHAFLPPDDTFRAFEATFPYEETPDQSKAIDEVLADLCAPRPMDRLVVGDAGYGKTEVAIRAAMKVVLDGKQVAVLVPTTVLAEQHLATFRQRMATVPVLLDSLSRFKTERQQKHVLQQLAEGKVDIVIGTHRLLQKDVRFKDLGLLIIDEEHRFGVAHKEKLKQYRNAVDVLAMTATPIPRTLHMSLVGLRDMTIIATPPNERRAVRTVVTRAGNEVIREAIIRELRRGGQVFFVHNRVETIERRAEELQRLVPEARMAIAHGQMGEKDLEAVMFRFVRGEVHVLVCTTIIESGLDIPQANTLVIDRADRFGLAQLYQIRGRVGRSRERAYAYFLIPNPTGLDDEARQRIAAIQRFSELGAGFHVASHDLELRGAGDLLGRDQHGHVNLVGLEMYERLLDEAIRELRGERPSSQLADVEVKIGLPAYLPDDWLPDETERLRLYRRVTTAAGENDLDEIEKEWEDRFGVLPEAVRNLLETMRLRHLARHLGIVALAYHSEGLSFQLTDDGGFTNARLVDLLNRPANRYRLSPDMTLTRPVSAAEWQKGLDTLRAALTELGRLVRK